MVIAEFQTFCYVLFQVTERDFVNYAVLLWDWLSHFILHKEFVFSEYQFQKFPQKTDTAMNTTSIKLAWRESRKTLEYNFLFCETTLFLDSHKANWSLQFPVISNWSFYKPLSNRNIFVSIPFRNKQFFFRGQIAFVY